MLTTFLIKSISVLLSNNSSFSRDTYDKSTYIFLIAFIQILNVLKFSGTLFKSSGSASTANSPHFRNKLTRNIPKCPSILFTAAKHILNPNIFGQIVLLKDSV